MPRYNDIKHVPSKYRRITSARELQELLGKDAKLFYGHYTLYDETLGEDKYYTDKPAKYPNKNYDPSDHWEMNEYHEPSFDVYPVEKDKCISPLLEWYFFVREPVYTLTVMAATFDDAQRLMKRLTRVGDNYVEIQECGEQFKVLIEE